MFLVGDIAQWHECVGSPLYNESTSHCFIDFCVEMIRVHRNINFLIISTGGGLARDSLANLSTSKELNFREFMLPALTKAYL